jgi:predicted double-glycine peptidase
MRPSRPILRGLAALVLTLALAAPAGAEAKTVRSLLDLRDEALVRQHWDLSCGAAAVATLITYQWNDPVTERQAALGMLRTGDVQLVRARLGFSLLDLKRFAATRGLAATGYAGLSLDELIGMAPAIVPLQARGAGHFVVVRGRRGDRVLLGDPAFGNRTLTTDAFLEAWSSRVGFVLGRPDDPQPPNRMGAPAELFLAPAAAVVRQSTVHTGNAGAPP